jgi:phenylalanyl-tRNA synthetase beta chain
MHVSGKWLAELVDLPKDVTPTVIAERLTAAGLEVESVVDLAAQIKGVVVARVDSCVPHPAADKLKLCRVDTGDGVVDVVCGAANVHGGALVCFARPGTVLPGGKKIDVAAVRGVTSHGMLCSASELGLESQSDGLLLLSESDPGVALGAPVAPLLGRDDVVYVLGVTPNRPDALSHMGVARELAAALRTRMKAPTPTCPERGGPIDGLARVTIEDPEGCPRYACRVIEDVVIGPSPRWLAARLGAVGIRSINNVVDVTNLVMMERGIPLHAFDYDKLGKSGSRAALVVRSARPGETLVTLDGKERTLVEGDVVIGDAAGEHGRAVAIAGVMGGRDTEVSSSTTRILLEGAHFNAGRVRRTSRRLDLHSEASHRFERGADANGVLQSLDRAAALIAEMSAPHGKETRARVARGVVDSYPRKVAPTIVTLRPRRAAALLGVPAKLVDEAAASKLLLSLGLEVEGREAEAIRFRVPTYRPDLTREVDLIEELLRLVGMDQVPATLPARGGEAHAGLFDVRRHRALAVARQALRAAGYDEAINLAFASPDDVARFPAWDVGGEPIRVKNPLGEERSLLRRSLLPGLVQNLATNHRRGILDVRLYEQGTVFLGRNGQGAHPRLDDKVAAAGGDAFAKERPRLCAIASGASAGAAFDRKASTLDFFDVKGHLEELLDTLGGSGGRFVSMDSDGPVAPFLHPRARATIRVEIDGAEVVLGVVGELHPDLAALYDLRAPAYVFDLDCELLALTARTRVRARPLPRYPAVQRDFAFLVDASLPSSALRTAFAQAPAARGLLETIDIFDVYQGAGVPEGKKSIALSVTLRAADRTLADADVGAVVDGLVASAGSLGAVVRAG